jgi:hypothetical protein
MKNLRLCGVGLLVACNINGGGSGGGGGSGSAPGTTWTRRTPEFSLLKFSLLTGVAYGNNTFVAVGDDGTILTSPDGVSWTARTSETGYGLYGVTYGNGTFVAVGWYGTILTSP